MRKGDRLKPWTVSEVRYLEDHAGELSMSELCDELGRSERSIACKASQLRKTGARLTLRQCNAQVFTCPSCGRECMALDRSGFCVACIKERQLQDIQRRIAELLEKLPSDVRAIYADTEAEVQSYIDPPPKIPKFARMSPYQERKARVEYAQQLEQWRLTKLHKQIRAAQKRKERIAKKLRSMRFLENE